ncbi:SMI1/KNR4 family protein [Deinococcus arcticus]|nr:SMI1/KNR4 family protein [Deinococcus arcticus]
MVRVALLDGETPVVLNEPGPPVAERDIAAFEALLDRALPADYRAFLLAYNGGCPVVTQGTGENGDEFMLSGFLELHPDDMDEPYTRHLCTPARREADYCWGLPVDALVFANDPGGNLFTLSLDDPRHTVRFIDHELDAPFETHRVLAQGFTAFLQLIRSVDAQAALDAAEQRHERETLTRGPFPAALEAQVQRAEALHPEVRAAVRRAGLAVFDAKSHFSLHADPHSLHVFDVMLWLHETATGPGITRSAMHEVLQGWFRDTPDGFGLTGYAPGFLDDWWTARFDDGILEGNPDGTGRFTPAARAALLAALNTHLK